MILVAQHAASKPTQQMRISYYRKDNAAVKECFSQHMMQISKGWTSWKKRKGMIMVLVLLALEVQTYRVKFRDCSTPTNIKQINIFTACDSESENEVEELAVLQQMRNQILKGHKCQVKRSQWTLYCGAFSHDRFIKNT